MLTTETFLFLCRKCELYKSDLEIMSIGMCLDYIDEYVTQSNSKNDTKTRKANQSDFDSF